MEFAPRALYRNNQAETPPVTDERMWASVYNALFFLAKDRELEWLRDVRATICNDDRKSTSLGGGA